MAKSKKLSNRLWLSERGASIACEGGPVCCVRENGQRYYIPASELPEFEWGMHFVHGIAEDGRWTEILSIYAGEAVIISQGPAGRRRYALFTDPNLGLREFDRRRVIYQAVDAVYDGGSRRPFRTAL